MLMKVFGVDAITIVWSIDDVRPEHSTTESIRVGVSEMVVALQRLATAENFKPG
jgi:hypothetical protein